VKFITTKTEEGIEDVFLFPRHIHHDAVAEMLEGIRCVVNGKEDWMYRRPVAAGFVTENFGCYGVSETLDLKSRQREDTQLLKQHLTSTTSAMKFITTQTKGGDEDVFVFPCHIDHDAMAEVLNHIKNQTHGNWMRIRRKPVSAGFVNEKFECHGFSETLGLKARDEDTVLLKKQHLN
jgi:cold shock CspA family protein